jgi:hypothetical protein
MQSLMTVLLMGFGAALLSAGALLALQRLRARQRHVTAAFELAHRQLQELRLAVENNGRRVEARANETADLLQQSRARVEPRLEALCQAARLRAAREELSASDAARQSGDGVARQLGARLLQLEQEWLDQSQAG